MTYHHDWWKYNKFPLRSTTCKVYYVALSCSSSGKLCIELMPLFHLNICSGDKYNYHERLFMVLHAVCSANTDSEAIYDC